MIFGRAQEEIDALSAAGVDFEIVPGITAALAASAELGVSLTRRGVSRSVVFATPRIGEGHTAGEHHAWARAVAAAETAVLYMSRGDATALTAALRAAGLPGTHPAAIVESASLPGAQRIACTLEELPERVRETTGGPALVVLGEVLRETLELHLTAEAPGTPRAQRTANE
jgi:uroporphyrin-III C-methyltransferase